jgi:hypothetical protein
MRGACIIVKFRTRNSGFDTHAAQNDADACAAGNFQSGRYQDVM